MSTRKVWRISEPRLHEQSAFFDMRFAEQSASSEVVNSFAKQLDYGRASFDMALRAKLRMRIFLMPSTK
jgi:hypothetical protein